MAAEKNDPKKQAKMSPKAQPKSGSDEEWQAAREGWAAEQVQKAHAHLLAKFDTDDDMPLSRHLLLMSIAGFFFIFFIWSNLAKLDEVTRGEGKVIPSSEVQAIQALDAGIVQEFLVREGDAVKSGQVLMRLSDIQASSDLGANQSRYHGLLAAITRLQAEAEGKVTVDFPPEVIKEAPTSVTEELNTFRANQTQLQGQINIFQQQMSQREQEVRELSGRASDIRGVIALQREEKAMVEPLVAKGSAPKMELLQLERTIKEKQTELNSVQSNLPRAQSAVAEARARIADLSSSAKAQAQTELSAKLIEMNELKERKSALTDRKDRTELKSPVNGTVQEIKVKTVGGVIKPGDDIIKIVPQDDQLIVEARVKPSDRAFIYPGQKAVIKITSYDFSIYGGLEGEVLDISADTLQDEKGNFYYRVRLRTYETELKHGGEVLPIIPGMVATADILTGQKTVMQYLLKPFVKTLDNAFNER
jgi:membrane fusion protein, adhesin transport system